MALRIPGRASSSAGTTCRRSRSRGCPRAAAATRTSRRSSGCGRGSRRATWIVPGHGAPIDAQRASRDPPRGRRLSRSAARPGGAHPRRRAGPGRPAQDPRGEPQAGERMNLQHTSLEIRREDERRRDRVLGAARLRARRRPGGPARRRGVGRIERDAHPPAVRRRADDRPARARRDPRRRLRRDRRGHPRGGLRLPRGRGAVGRAARLRADAHRSPGRDHVRPPAALGSGHGRRAHRRGRARPAGSAGGSPGDCPTTACSQRLLVRDVRARPDLERAEVATRRLRRRRGRLAARSRASTPCSSSRPPRTATASRAPAMVDASVAAGVGRIVYTSFVGAAPDARSRSGATISTPRSTSRPRASRYTFLRDNLYLDFIPGLAGPTA